MKIRPINVDDIVTTKHSQFFSPLILRKFLFFGCFFLATAFAEELPLSVSPNLAAPGQTVTVNGDGFQDGARALVWGGQDILTSNIDTPDQSFGVVVSGSYAYVADFEGGLHIIDITIPSSPSIVGSLNSVRPVNLVINKYAYVTDITGIKVVDISDPTSPFIIGSLISPSGAGAYDLVISGNYAYVTSRETLLVVDISDPTSPHVVGSISTPDSMLSIVLKDNYAYVANRFEGLKVIDISDPTSPFIAGHIATTGGDSYAVAISGDYVYVSDQAGIKVVDISDPTLPTIVRSITIPEFPFTSFPYDIAISGNYAYVACYTNLKVIDITNPLLPSVVSSVETPGDAYGVTTSGQYVYVADVSNGLSIFPVAISSNTNFVDSETLEVTLPTHLPDGTYDVTVLIPDGTIYKSYNAITITGTPITSSISIETFTNGVDADEPPGPNIVVGQPITWTYEVTNTGTEIVYDIDVVDDQGVTVSCLTDILNPGQFMTCTGDGIAEIGQYENKGTVNGITFDGPIVTDSDLSHYLGVVEEKIILLLHGMNSDPSTWDDYVTFKFNGSCPTIYNGAINGNSTPNKQGISCYRVEFGVYDSGTGLEGVKPSISGSSGDFSTFDQLSTEVLSAVQSIVSRHFNAEIVLIAHSRGGVAARAFLQNQNLTYFSSHFFIKGLLTIGTPHIGSPLGRFWEYLNGHPRNICEFGIPNQPCIKDWHVVDFLNNKPFFPLITNCQPLYPFKPTLDVRTPTIDYLSDLSDQILDLNNNIKNLYNGPIVYGQLKYQGLNFGILQPIEYKGIRLYSIFDSKLKGDLCPQVTTPKDIPDNLSSWTSAQEVMLGAKEPRNFNGDGIVPYENQDYINHPDFPAGAKKYDGKTKRKTLHTKEPEETDDIEKVILDMMGSDWSDL